MRVVLGAVMAAALCAIASASHRLPSAKPKIEASQPTPRPIPSELPSDTIAEDEAPRAAYAAFLHTEVGNRPPSGEPNAWVYVPTRFDPKQRLRVVMFFHGYHNCVRSFVADQGVPCRQFDSPRTAYGIAAHMERAELGSIAIVPQLAFDRDSSDPLCLGEPGAARALLREIVEKHLREAIGARTLEDVDDVTFVAASGGTSALGPVLLGGKVANVHRVVLMDAYYAPSLALDEFVIQNLDAFADGRRLAVVYSDGRPLTPTLEFAARIEERLKKRGSLEWLTHAPLPHAVATSDFSGRISFVRSALDHDDVMRFDLWKALAGGGAAPP